MKKYVLVFMLTLALTLVIGILLYERCREDRVGISEYEEIRVMASVADEVAQEDVVLPNIDETMLARENRDYAAWIYIPGTAINYPVVLPENNDFYLARTFRKEKNVCGCLFFDAGTDSLFSSLNTVIHGHNMKSGAMFGGLKLYLQETYAVEHPYMYIYSNGEWEKYRFISVYRTSFQDVFPYQTVFFSAEDFRKYVNAVKIKNIVKTEEDDEKEINNMVTLSTCYGKKEKLIVQWAAQK